MIGAQFHGSCPFSSTTTLSGLTSSLRRRVPSSLVVVPPVLPIRRKMALVASAKKFRGRHRPLPRSDCSVPVAAEEGDDDTGAIIFPGPSDLASEFPPDGGDDSCRSSKLQPLASEPSSKNQSPSAVGKNEEPVKGASLRGLDVLLAMQNAAAQRNNRKGKSRQAGAKSAGVAVKDGDDSGAEARPLNIRKDWATRLEELAKAIEEFQQQQHGQSM